jgi:hypothetical protein
LPGFADDLSEFMRAQLVYGLAIMWTNTYSLDRNHSPERVVRIMKRLLLSLLLAAPAALAETYLYDLGTGDSDVWPGCERVTVTNVLGATNGFGWQTSGGLEASFRAYTRPTYNANRDRMDPPPIWTNPLTEDSIVGSRENVFFIRAKPGKYQLYLVCGVSSGPSSQYFDFTVLVGAEHQRVQIEGSQQFRSLRFRAVVGAEPLAIHLRPRSKWCVSGIMAWPVSEAARVEKALIAPFEEWTYRMPPEEWAQWKEEPGPAGLVDNRLGPGSASAEGIAGKVWDHTDRQRGFGVYSRPYLECIYPHSPARAGDRNPTLRLFASPGEYEPANFIVCPLKDLTGAKVTVSDLGPISASDIDVRRVRYLRARPNYITLHSYHIVPDILEHFSTLELKSGENTRFWLTVHVPDTATPGNYTGSVQFACDSGKVTLPLQMRILPIRLREDPEKIFGIYYRHPYDQMASAPDDISREYFRRKADLEHADMVAHGIRNIVLSVDGSPADSEGRFRFNWDLLAAKLDLWKKYQFRAPIVMGINTLGVYAKYMGERPGSHLRGVKDPPEAFSRELTAMVRAIEVERKTRGWPEFLYYPVDEPSRGSASVSFMVKVLQACKAAGVRTYLTANPTLEEFAPLRPYVDVWCTQPFSPDRETVLADMKARPVEYWCYPNHVAGENDHTPVAGARMTFGFGFWRSGFRTLIPWIYSATIGDPFNYLDGSAMDFLNRQEPDGTPMPVVLWEAYREGYDDYRYVYTLEQLIAAAKQDPRPAAQEASRTAQRELERVWDAIRVQPKYKYDGLWAPEEFDAHRWRIAQQITRLQDALSTAQSKVQPPASNRTSP